MFKATFPYAEVAEEVTERAYLKSLPSANPDETVNVIWIPAEQAFQLAVEYEITPWIQALLDETPVHPTPSRVYVGGASHRSEPHTPLSLLLDCAA
jgi:hypothetical protein